MNRAFIVARETEKRVAGEFASAVAGSGRCVSADAAR
jgi:hypothetical protein